MKCRNVPCAFFFVVFFFSPQVPVFTFGLSNRGINLSHLVPEEQQSSESAFMNDRGRSPVFKRAGMEQAERLKMSEPVGQKISSGVYWKTLCCST